MSDHTAPADAPTATDPAPDLDGGAVDDEDGVGGGGAIDTADREDAPTDEDDALAGEVDAAPERTTPPGTALVAIAFDDELKAQEALIACMRLQKHKRLALDDAAIVIKTDSGRIRLVQTRDVNAPQGAATGSWWGLVAGLFVGGPLVGAALGAAVGGIWAKLRDIGIDDDTMRELGETLRPGDAALFLLATDGHRVHVLHEARRFDGRLLLSTLDDDWTRLLEEALSEGVNPWG